MKRNEILAKIKQYFSAAEFVGVEAYNRYGEDSFRFIDTNLLHCVLIIREGLGAPITANTHHVGGRFDERGLRDVTQPIMRARAKSGRLYLSAHIFGKAIDFDMAGFTAIEVREWIVANEALFPCKIRLERNSNGVPISWVHLDVMDHENNPKIYQFDV